MFDGNMRFDLVQQPWRRLWLIGHGSCPIVRMKPIGSARPDPVSDALAALSVRSTVFCTSDLRAPWAFRVEGEAFAKFHLVVAGSGWLTVDGQAPMALGPGDLAILPHGHGHVVSDRPGGSATLLDQLLIEHPLDDRARWRFGGDGERTGLICGGFALAEPFEAGLLGMLPSLVVVDAQAVAATAWLEPVLRGLEAESRDGRPGAGAVQARIADVFLTQAIRSWVTAAERSGLTIVGSITDPQLGPAIEAIRRRYSEPWTLDRLAALVDMSRTAFAVRFRNAIGEGAIRHLTRVRLSQAAGHLTTGSRSLKEIATLTGYDSDAALSKAFKREFGEPPGSVRARSRRPVDLIASPIAVATAEPTRRPDPTDSMTLTDRHGEVVIEARVAVR